MQKQAWASGTPKHHSEPKIDENTPANCAVISIDFDDDHARLLMDGVAHDLTAQQCGMLVCILAETVEVLAGTSDTEACRQAALIFKNYKLWYGLIEIRTTSEEEDMLKSHVYWRTEHEYFFAGYFRGLHSPPGTQNYHAVQIAAGIDSNRTVISYDSKIVQLDIAQTSRLVEQLWIAGYLKAQVEAAVGHNVPDPSAVVENSCRPSFNFHEQPAGGEAFNNLRKFEWHGYGVSGTFPVTVKHSNKHVILEMDGSHHHLSAQNCAEIAKNLTTLLATNYELGFQHFDEATLALLAASLEWHKFIHERAGCAGANPMDIFTGHKRGYEFIASACFQSNAPSASASLYHRVLIALDEDVGLPCISIDNRAFPMSIEEALWLIENLQMAGYVAAMANE
ncbi:hypothetical protein [Pseudomonas juntendi]|uniref:hypothetical protein n=1 Tax=Pseudomonas juntendi TaxID=2666183 RepID=UPI00320B545D